MTAPEKTATAPALHEVADGVFAYIQPDGGWCVSNAGVIAGRDQCVLVDTTATESRTRALRERIAGVINPAGPSLLVNTHHHGDHVFGNGQFVPGATVIAHEQTREEMRKAGLGLRTLWPDVEWGETPLTLPTLTFRDRVTIHVDDELRAELLHFGPAHTTNDVVAWIPERKVLFAGDVLMAGVTPYCLMGSIEGSLRTIAQLRLLGAETIIAGHGPVSGPDLFDRNESYLRWIQQLAADGGQAGLTPLEVARAADLGEFAGLLDSERLVGNLHRAYAELAGGPLGAPIDVLGSFKEMVEFHGGLPGCHA